ncbi:MAG: hypothetical protein KKA05_09130 [Alphaproteobacteria bacterium]|nr:hypothetical protein [Alphaproteobacteria bacterium]
MQDADLQADPSEFAQAQALSQSPDIVLVAGSIKGAMKEAGAASRDLWFVPRGQIRVIQDFNVRIEGPGLEAHIRWLADSMKSEGFKSEHPLAGYVAREGDASVIYITDGHCRLRASDLAVSEGAEIELLPMVISTKAKSLEDITVGMGRAASGKPLEALEKAALCKRLSNWGWEESRIAERLGMTTTYVRDLLTLIGAPVQVRELVAQDKISASAALQAMATHGNKVVEKLNEGLAKAKAMGKARMTPRHMSDPGEKVVAKEGPKLFSVAKELRSDPGFAHLSEPVQKKLTELLAQIEGKCARAVKRANEKQGKASTTNDSDPAQQANGANADPQEGNHPQEPHAAQTGTGAEASTAAAAAAGGEAAATQDSQASQDAQGGEAHTEVAVGQDAQGDAGKGTEEAAAEESGITREPFVDAA